MTEKTYLGDGAYAQIDQFGSVVLTTEDGIEATNSIVLELEVLERFLLFLKQTDNSMDTAGYGAPIARAIELEREACAVLVERWPMDHCIHHPDLKDVAAGIRARITGE